MTETDADLLLFFEGHADALNLYFAFEKWLRDCFPTVERSVKKTQISFYNRHLFACISFARVQRGAGLPRGYLTLSLGLPAPLYAKRVAARVEAYPGRWTHHIVLSRPEELDGELLSWIQEAYAFAEAKR